MEKKQTLWEAIEADEFKAYDALTTIIKDFYAPDDNEEAYRIEDMFNAKFSEFMEEMDEYMARKEKACLLEWEKQIREFVNSFGEEEETAGTHRFWLDALNGVCDIDGHTDVLSVLTSTRTDGSECVQVQVNTQYDDSTIFVDLDELPYQVVKAIILQLKA